MTRDPPRLCDDPAGPQLARALREAQGDVLPPEAVARVRTALHAAGIVGVGAASAASLAAAVPSLPVAFKPLSTWAKLLGSAVRLRVGLMVVGLAVGVGGAASMARAPSHEEPSTPAEHATVLAPSAPVEPATALPSAEVSASPPESGAPADAPPALTAETARARGSLRPQGAGAAPSPREGALLLEARRALGANPARALALVRAHEQEFPRSQLGPERARIAAEARRRLEK